MFIRNALRLASGRSFNYDYSSIYESYDVHETIAPFAYSSWVHCCTFDHERGVDLPCNQVAPLIQHVIEALPQNVRQVWSLSRKSHCHISPSPWTSEPTKKNTSIQWKWHPVSVTKYVFLQHRPPDCMYQLNYIWLTKREEQKCFYITGRIEVERKYRKAYSVAP